MWFEGAVVQNHRLVGTSGGHPLALPAKKKEKNQGYIMMFKTFSSQISTSLRSSLVAPATVANFDYFFYAVTCTCYLSPSHCVLLPPDESGSTPSQTVIEDSNKLTR